MVSLGIHPSTYQCGTVVRHAAYTSLYNLVRLAGNSAGPVVNTMSSVNAATGHSVTQMMPVQGVSTADLMSSVPVGGVPVDYKTGANL